MESPCAPDTRALHQAMLQEMTLPYLRQLGRIHRVDRRTIVPKATLIESLSPRVGAEVEPLWLQCRKAREKAATENRERRKGLRDKRLRGLQLVVGSETSVFLCTQSTEPGADYGTRSSYLECLARVSYVGTNCVDVQLCGVLKEHGPHDSPADVHEHARSGECVLLRWNLDRFQLAYKMPATEHHVFCYLG